NALSTPSGKIEIFSETIARFKYDDCPQHPSWIEPAEWLGGAQAEKFPLHLFSHQPSVRLHSQLDPSRLSAASKVLGREPLRMNPVDAERRGLRSGDTVRVFNDRGSFLAALQIVDHLKSGVVPNATGARFERAEPGRPGSLEKHGNPNVVTDDHGTSRLAQSSVAQTVLVEVERLAAAPPVTAFAKPSFLHDLGTDRTPSRPA